ncbi:MAG TPA: TIGR03885 family FMN-dependent LLM class oxidoreductase [Gammaproteobacteria bacterium]
MTRYGYHASHEQHAPSALLAYVRLAEHAGFDAAMCSDHFHPWVPTQGQSGFAWSWLGAALGATRVDFGCVTSPGWRYHPAVIAQAAATLAEMYPDRFWLAVGSGEALNEHICGAPWPPKGERNARLLEAVGVMRALWAGETVTHYGRITVEEAKLYTRPRRPPAVFGAALTPATARWLGGWADGLMTVGADEDTLRALIGAFREGGGEGKPIKVQCALAWAPTDDDALQAAHREWAANLLGTEMLAVLRTPEQFHAASRFVSVDDVARVLPVSSDPARHVEHLRRYAELGIDDVYLHNVARNQPQFIDVFGARVLPQLR